VDYPSGMEGIELGSMDEQFLAVSAWTRARRAGLVESHRKLTRFQKSDRLVMLLNGQLAVVRGPWYPEGMPHEHSADSGLEAARARLEVELQKNSGSDEDVEMLPPPPPATTAGLQKNSGADGDVDMSQPPPAPPPGADMHFREWEARICSVTRTHIFGHLGTSRLKGYA
jgi:hypothetical protein